MPHVFAKGLVGGEVPHRGEARRRGGVLERAGGRCQAGLRGRLGHASGGQALYCQPACHPPTALSACLSPRQYPGHTHLGTTREQPSEGPEAAAAAGGRAARCPRLRRRVRRVHGRGLAAIGAAAVAGGVAVGRLVVLRVQREAAGRQRERGGQARVGAARQVAALLQLPVPPPGLVAALREVAGAGRGSGQAVARIVTSGASSVAGPWHALHAWTSRRSTRRTAAPGGFAPLPDGPAGRRACASCRLACRSTMWYTAIDSTASRKSSR